jgi:hypothetical protein
MRPFYLEKDEDSVQHETPCDLSHLFTSIEASSVSRTVKEIRGDKYRFHICRLHKKERIWELQILRLREKMLPGIATEEGEYELIELEEGKYPAETITALYDEFTCRLYVQRNIFGISLSSLGTYIGDLLPAETSILLKPIAPKSRIGQMTPTKKYRKVVFTCEPDFSDSSENQSRLSRILRVFNRYQGSSVTISIGFGRKSGYLNADEASELIKEAYAAGAQKLEVRMADNEDVEIHTIDLLDDIESYTFEMEYSRQNPITHKRLFISLKEKFCEDYHR